MTLPIAVRLARGRPRIFSTNVSSSQWQNDDIYAPDKFIKMRPIAAPARG
jgi:hypothetical protein